ncbi:MAG: aminodeoxychorismate lyase [Gammaproteobacteria bacterium]
MTAGWDAAAAVRIFVGQARVDAVPADDRGLAYGDGLFETMRAHACAVPWWERHWARLALGAARLGLALPPEALVRDQAADLLGDAAGDAVLRLLVTRGRGRGYAPPAAARPTWVLSLHPPPPIPARGLRLGWCGTRLALQPALAGLKHCNRLEQVLARAALAAADPQADEGLLRSAGGDVVCATAANLFVFGEAGWATPPVDRCGVAGVCRGWILETTGARERRLAVADVESAQALVLCNAVRGILPVARLGGRSWPPHPQVAALQRRLASAHPAFAALEVP